MKRSYRYRPLITLLCALAAPGCNSPDPEVGVITKPIYGNVAGIDWHIDAPWRIEPATNNNGVYTYDAVPITFAIQDGVHAAGGPDPTLGESAGEELGGIIPVGGLGRFCALEMFRYDEGSSNWISDRKFLPGDMYEYHMESPWMSTGLPDGQATVRRWKGETLGTTAVPGAPAPLDQQNPFDWGGWNAIAQWTPTVSVAAGTNLLVRAVAVVAPDCSAVAGTTLSGDGPQFDKVQASGTTYYAFRQVLRVRYGHPLPRFDSRWAYGDLHYHSEGTDNEGESGHSFRAVAQAMRAIGLDFLYATDHTSGSDQMTDSRVPGINIDLKDKVPYLPGLLEDYAGEYAEDKINEFLASTGFGPFFTFALRDMNDRRWNALEARLNDQAGGVNREAVSAPGALRAPQIFLGGETDIVPEMSLAEQQAGFIPYGNGKRYPWAAACSQDHLPGFIFELFPTICAGADLDDQSVIPGQFVVKDIQGVTAAAARQHILHLPRRPGPNGRANQTSGVFGGAKMHLSEFVQDNQDRNIGYYFLAHPVDGASGNDVGRLGPDMVPYSDVQLRRALNSRDFLGLQVWNEDDRVKTHGGIGPMTYSSRDAKVMYGLPGNPLQECINYYGSPLGVSFRWLSQTGSVPSYECSRGVASSQGNLGFPTVQGTGTSTRFAVASSGDKAPLNVAPYTTAEMVRLHAWEQRTDFTERNLFHGATTWDKMLRWGVRPDRSDAALTAWLPADEPRKVFMAGGSDAHGDFNYRQSGYATGWQGSNDTALGKPRNLVFVGADRPATSSANGRTVGTLGQNQVAEALHAGNFAVTDGPAVRIAVDLNGNGTIDDTDVPMGEVHRYADRTSIPVLVEWRSTPEWGAVNRVDLYVGNSRVTYAPENHGVRAADDNAGTAYLPVYLTGGTTAFASRYQDGYYKPATGGGELRHSPSSLAGTHRFNLDLRNYPGFTATCDDRQECKQVWIPPYKQCSDEGACFTIPGHYETQCTTIKECRAPSKSVESDLYVRAFVSTAGNTEPVQWNNGTFINHVAIPRYGYTNPVWVSPPRGAGGQADGMGGLEKWSDWMCVKGETCLLADMNGDKIADAVAFIKNSASDGTRGDIWVALSDGASFGAPQKWSDWFCGYDQTCLLADVNGDGKADAVEFERTELGAEFKGDVYVMLSTGAGFGGVQKWSDYMCVDGETCLLADMNGDGKADAVALIKQSMLDASRADIWVALSNGTTFGAPQKWSDWFCGFNQTCLLADVNGDGKADAVEFERSELGADFEGDVYVLPSTGAGFGAAVKFADAVCTGDETCMMADMNGDGRADALALVKGSKSDGTRGDVYVALSYNTAFGAPAKWSDALCADGETCLLADVSGDAAADLVSFVKSTRTDAGEGDALVSRAPRSGPAQ